MGKACAEGITPAYAGKSQGLADIYEVLGDHPRVCGEKSELIPPGKLPPGSPPRMRGKAPVVRDIVRDLGITPAYAGKSRGQEETVITH